MRLSIIRAVLAPDIPGTPATLGVALGLMGTLSSDIANDLAAAQRALGQRRRHQHDEVLAEAVEQAESLAYVARWIAARVRPAKTGADLPVVMIGLDDDVPPSRVDQAPRAHGLVP